MNAPMAKKDAYHHGDLRAGLVEAARVLVEREGPERLSLSAACRAARVSTAAPYRHFADKDALLLAVALEGLHRQSARMQAATEAHPPGSVEAIAAIGLAYVDFAQAEPGVFRLMFGLTRAHEGNADVLAAGQACFGVVLRQVALRDGKTEIDGAIVATGFRLWTFVHGLAFLLIDEKTVAMNIAFDVAAFIRDGTRRLLAP